MVDGERESVTDTGTFAVGDTEVRVDDIFQYGDNSDNTDSVTLSIGSEELVLEDGQAIQDGEGDDVDGTKVMFQGTDSGNSGLVHELAGIEVYVGAQDDDREYVMAGESYAHPMFENYEFHFGGLNPWAAEEGDNVGQVEVSTSGDDTMSLSFTSNTGDSANINWGYSSNTDSNGGDITEAVNLASDDGEDIVVHEGSAVQEDDYFVSDAGNFAHLWEVTNVNMDEDSAALASDDEATVDLKDAVSGSSVEVDLDADTNEDLYEGTEVIDGQTYHFQLTKSGDLHATWGTDAGHDVANGVGPAHAGAEVSLYSALDTDSGAAVALADEVTVNQKFSLDSTATTITSGSGTGAVEVTTASNQEAVVTLSQSSTSSEETVYVEDGSTVTTDLTSFDRTSDIDVTVHWATSGDGITLDDTNGNTGTATPTGDTVDYVVPSTESSDAKSFSVDYSSYSSTTKSVSGSGFEYDISSLSSKEHTIAPASLGDSVANVGGTEPGVMVIEPEDDKDVEEGYIVQPNYDDNDEELGVQDATFTDSGTMDKRSTSVTLESNDD